MKTVESSSISYLALDVETSNADYSSICQIGIAYFQNGQIIDTWSSLIDPLDYFDPFNVSIHGITSTKVKGAPTFREIYTELKSRIAEKIVIHHMPFDRTAINRACTENDLELIQVDWLDSAKIVRRTWEQFAHRGYGLANIAEFLDIKFDHHDALEDAVAAGKVVDQASQISGLTVEDWLTRVRKPIFNTSYSKIQNLEGDPEGLLYGENIVFTGALFLTRAEAAQLASKLGCCVSNSVTKKTSILVVGTQEVSKLAGYQKSSKHRKVEELINNGLSIKILSENDFFEICKSHIAESIE